MEICERKHTKIVYDDFDCPLCSLINEKENLINKIELLEADVVALKDDNTELENRVNQLEAEAE